MENFFQRPQQGAVRVANFVPVSPPHTLPQSKKRDRPIAIGGFIGNEEHDHVTLPVLGGVEDPRQKAPQPPIDMGDLIAAAAVVSVVADIGRDEVVSSDCAALEVAAQFTQRPYVLYAVGRVRIFAIRHITEVDEWLVLRLIQPSTLSRQWTDIP